MDNEEFITFVNENTYYSYNYCVCSIWWHILLSLCENSGDKKGTHTSAEIDRHFDKVQIPIGQIIPGFVIRRHVGNNF